MFAASLPEDRVRRPTGENPWHNTAINRGEDPVANLDVDGHGTTAVPSPEGSDQDQLDGTWGERDTGIRSHTMAMEDYEVLRRNLTDLSRSHTGRRSVSRPRTPRSTSANLFRTVSGQTKSRKSEMEEAAPTESADSKESEKPSSEEEGEFELEQFMREGHFEKRVEGRSAKRVGVVWKNLTVKGVGSSTTFVRTLPDAIVGTFGPDLYHILSRFIPFLRFSKHQQTRDLVHDFSGVVRDGEMMIVLGRPGSGCSTFLKTIANERESFAAVEGDISYGGISAEKQKKQFRGEVNYNPEDDRHFASLTVWQTLKFSLLNKTKKREKYEIPVIVDALLKMFGITHTKHTVVGDEYTRGVSGGERKRVSIAETLAGKSSVVCWDNSTRGLDSSTALDYAKSLRIMTDVSDRTTFVTLYQAGEQIYELMDKVLVIDTGRCVYNGPAKDAKQYFIDLGFFCPERQTTPDFLTAVTDPTERRIREGYENRVPRTPEELENAYKSSAIYQHVQRDIESYERHLEQTNYSDARQFEETAKEQKSNKTVAKKSSYTVSFPRQVMACTQREFWLLLGDKQTLYTKFFIIVSNGLIVGSLFYGQPLNTEGAFTRGGSLFFSILFLGWLQLSELMKAVSGRAVVARHKDYAFYRPSAVSVARVVADLPMLLVQVIPFTIILYFMCNLDVDVSKFFIYLLFVYTNTLCITALYRMFASVSPEIDTAVRFSGIALNLLVIYTGYVIPKTQLLSNYIWFGWLYYINPIAYAFEAVLTNEFAGRTMECASAQLVPQGPGVDPAYQGCSLTGAAVNAHSVDGSAYLKTQFNYSRSHLWRNWGVVIAYAVLYIIVTVIATELFSFASGGGGALIFKRSKKAKQQMKEQQKPSDEETGRAPPATANTEMTNAEGMSMQKTKSKADEALEQISSSDSVFTWKDVTYTVPYLGGEKRLLNGVSGFAKPGLMVALMGASGAGKTTLLNTLARRQKVGVIGGDMLVDGKDPSIDFQRGTGFCEQMDLHDGTATIREALEFSAILRQDKDVPRSEKIEYVDKIIDLLELEDMQDAIVASLGVEQKKRLTIGVELAAKPSLLLFLDEPTSGLDSNSAYSIVRFLKKLSQAGQAIVCTIHQPSSILIQQFDMVLALNPGGNTFYFGPIGEDGKDVIKYFADRGVQCPPKKNVAEFILETAAKGGRKPDGKRIDWNQEWRDSENNQEILREIERVCAERARATEFDNKGAGRAFAAPVWLQITELTKRTFVQYWRDPSYLYGKLFTSVIIGIFNGFTFYMLGNSTQDMQNRMFTAFLIIVFPPTIVNAVVPKFYSNMALWQARELPSRIYGWVAFSTAQVVCEIPPAIVGALVYWLLWYYPTGLPTDSATAGYVFLMTMLFFLFQASWGQWICAFAPSFTVISNVLPFFFVMFSLFNGVVRPYSMLPVFWRYWMYYVNPSTYWIGGVLAATLHNQPVECTVSETARFDPPPGQTCQQYAGSYAASANGHFLNPNASTDCQYCPYNTGDDYLATLNIQYSDKWKCFGVFLAFCISNWALVYFLVWSVRIKGWSFGFGLLFGGLGKGVKKVKGMFSGKKGEKSEKA
ncbi:ABC drug exporter AtrF [Saccharata proteae CBS 121410]|uniref:ABC multidrug transporter atrF n=1 Tax=Saccharata proteae CBS 121410 TaxID=1314787 RepID=A0A9P4HXG2_9PEZI|nr:ABC drug exporter AtrF [Saccharata proteae CBS 121410]